MLGGKMAQKELSTISVADIWQAHSRIKSHILRTPMLFSPALSRRLDGEVYLKLECWQMGGCFKVRGAVNFVTSLSEEERARELVTATSGNHGIGVAYAGSLFGGSPAMVFLPENADPLRLEKIQALGAKIVLQGKYFSDAYVAARKYAEQQGSTFVHSHADPRIIAGQGTIGIEILEDLPDVGLIVAPIGGGGLISGISLAVKTCSPSTRIVGAEPSAAPSAYLSMQDGNCRETIEVKPSITDGLLGGIGQLPFEIFRSRIEGVHLVDDQEVVNAMRVLQQDEQLMVEPAAAVGLAALLAGKIKYAGEKIVLVITSRNIEAGRYNRLINQ
jgi:threonine dehydratase